MLLSAFLLSIWFILLLGTTIRILLRSDISSSGRLAWFVVVILLPVMGTLLYFLFGEVWANRRIRRRHYQVAEALAPEIQALHQQQQPQHPIPSPYHTAFAYAESINGFAYTQGNQVELMTDATQTHARMLADLHQAQQSICLLYYIWLEDKTGTAIAHALIDAAKRGVTCRIIVDALGSRSLTRSSLWRAMRAAGVQQHTAMPFKYPLIQLFLDRLDLRNHRKITLIDSHITYCGSQNCADPYFSPKIKFAPWVDIMLRIEGPVVAQNQLLFASDWLLNDEDSYIEQFPLNIKTTQGKVFAQATGTGPTERRFASAQMFVSLISLAQQELCITTPYFVPDPTVLNAICAVALRGVKVILILPQQNDSRIVSAASQSFFLQLLESGVIIKTYRLGLLHAKIMTIDSKITRIGSSNLDNRSFDLNFENDMLFYDTHFVAQVRQRQRSYEQDSDTISLETVRTWSIKKRIWNNIIGTLGPLL